MLKCDLLFRECRVHLKKMQRFLSNVIITNNKIAFQSKADQKFIAEVCMCQMLSK